MLPFFATDACTGGSRAYAPVRSDPVLVCTVREAVNFLEVVQAETGVIDLDDRHPARYRPIRRGVRPSGQSSLPMNSPRVRLVSRYR